METMESIGKSYLELNSMYYDMATTSCIEKMLISKVLAVKEIDSEAKLKFIKIVIETFFEVQKAKDEGKKKTD